MLRAGGSSVDAAIAAQMVLTLVEPQASGIGGGSFMLLAERNGTMTAYDGRETAPASASPTMFLDTQGKPRAFMDAVVGGLSVGVPGNIAMLAKAHREHGRLPWARLFQPAIRLAADGFRVPPRMANAVQTPHLSESPAMKALFFHPDGTPIVEGEVWKNPELAATLRTIARGGEQAFYKGSVANAIVEAVSRAPRNATPFTLADLASYRAVNRNVICITYRSYKVCSVSPPAGGTVVLQTLALLQRFKSAQLKPASLSAIHLISEAERLAYADRARWLGDPMVTGPIYAGLLDPKYIAERGKLIDPTRDMGLAAPGTPPVKHTLDFAPQRTPVGHGTSHMSIVDDRGEVISMTTTVESVFGSYQSAGGFVLNNQLTDFSFEPVRDGLPVANAPAPGKRPLSSMSPVIIFDARGKFWAATGSPDGRNIIAYVVQNVSALIDGRMPMQAAIDLPHHVNQNGNTQLEQGTPLSALEPQLTAMGHTVSYREYVSGLAGIHRVKGGYEGGADHHRDYAATGD